MSENTGTANSKVIYYNGDFIKVSDEFYYGCPKTGLLMPASPATVLYIRAVSRV
ncbi:MAG: hypothetical protein ACI4I9_02155 [Porcipelethomonas sp.]